MWCTFKYEARTSLKQIVTWVHCEVLWRSNLLPLIKSGSNILNTLVSLFLWCLIFHNSNLVFHQVWNLSNLCDWPRWNFCCYKKSEYDKQTYAIVETIVNKIGQNILLNFPCGINDGSKSGKQNFHVYLWSLGHWKLNIHSRQKPIS